jgi:hypothetical protein
MNLTKVIQTLERRRDYLATRTQQDNSEGARNWDKQEKKALEIAIDKLGCSDPMPDASDLRNFRKMEGNTI